MSLKRVYRTLALGGARQSRRFWSRSLTHAAFRMGDREAALLILSLVRSDSAVSWYGGFSIKY